jgi:hypothetical protein
MRVLRPLLLLIFLPLLGAACPTSPEGSSELQRARMRWARQGLVSYRYDYARSCFCLAESTRPVTIEVRDGAVATVIDRETGQVVTTSHGIRWPTIPDLFAEVERATREADDFRVTYDRERGHPTEFFADWIARAADDEGGFSASNVRAVPR